MHNLIRSTFVGLVVLPFIVGCGGVIEPGDEQSVSAEAKGGGHNTFTLIGHCTATPNPAALYSVVTVSGCGFAAATILGFSVNNSLGFTVTDANGCYSRSFDAVWSGTNTVNVTAGRSMETCTFDVI